MKILLTGTTGQVGNALAQSLQDCGTLFMPTRAECDLSQTESLRTYIQDIKPDIIINPAAFTAVDLAETQSELAHSINTLAPQVMAEEAKKLGIPLIHFSTDYVFDGEKKDVNGTLISYIETDTCNPQNIYGKTKLAGEQAIIQSGCAYFIFRTSWVYSLFGKNFLLTMLKLATQRDALHIVNDQWGAPTSALWLAEVTTQIVKQMMQKPDKATLANWYQQHQGIYHMTPSGKTNWQGFAQTIMLEASKHGLLEKSPPTIHGIPSSEYPTPAKRPFNSCLDTTQLASQFQLAIPTWETLLQQLMAKQS